MKRIMALIFTLLLVAAFALTVVGCKKAEEQKPAPAAPAAPAEAPAAPAAPAGK